MAGRGGAIERAVNIHADEVVACAGQADHRAQVIRVAEHVMVVRRDDNEVAVVHDSCRDVLQEVVGRKNSGSNVSTEVGHMEEMRPQVSVVAVSEGVVSDDLIVLLGVLILTDDADGRRSRRLLHRRGDVIADDLADRVPGEVRPQRQTATGGHRPLDGVVVDVLGERARAAIGCIGKAAVEDRVSQPIGVKVGFLVGAAANRGAVRGLAEDQVPFEQVVVHTSRIVAVVVFRKKSIRPRDRQGNVIAEGVRIGLVERAEVREAGRGDDVPFEQVLTTDFRVEADVGAVCAEKLIVLDLHVPDPVEKNRANVGVEDIALDDVMSTIRGLYGRKPGSRRIPGVEGIHLNAVARAYKVVAGDVHVHGGTIELDEVFLVGHV